MVDAVMVVDSEQGYAEVDIINAELREEATDFITTRYQGRRYWVHGGPGTRTDRFINVSRPL